MTLKQLERYIFSRVTVVSAVAFILVALLLTVNHIIGIATLLFKVPPALLFWIEIGIDVFFVLIIGSFTVYWMSRLDLERKQAELLFRDLFIHSPVGLFIVQGGKFQVVNPEFQRESGYDEDELLGTESMLLVHPEDREMVRESAVAMLKGKRSSAYEYRFLRKDGNNGLIMERVISIRYRGGRAALGTFMDITERSQVEEKIKQAAQE